MSNCKKASSVVVPLLVIALLIISGPAQAITILISSLPTTSVNAGDFVSFTVQVELHDPDQYVPMQRVLITLSGNNSRQFVLDMDGHVESGYSFPSELSCSQLQNDFTTGYSFGYGYGYGYLHGSGYFSQLAKLPLGYGYGYANDTSYPDIWKYSCSLNTSRMFDGYTTIYAQAKVAPNTTISSSAYYFNESTTHSFTLNPRVITVSNIVVSTSVTGGTYNTGIIETPIGNYTYIIYANGTTIPVTINVTVFVNPPADITSLSNFTNLADVSGAISDAYFNLTVNNSAWYANITAIELRFFYNASRIPSGVDESTLRPMKFVPGSGWYRLTTGSALPDGTTVYGAGVNTSAKYVWANVSKLSVFGIGGTVSAAAAPSVGGTYRPQAVVLANSIDKALAADFYGFLRNQGIDIIEATPSNFGSYKTSVRFIIILGGPDAPEGIGEIVKGILGSDEQKFLRARGNRKMYVKTNVYRTGQVVRIIAGSGRTQTQEEVQANKIDVGRRIKYNLD